MTTAVTTLAAVAFVYVFTFFVVVVLVRSGVWNPSGKTGHHIEQFYRPIIFAIELFPAFDRAVKDFLDRIFDK